jgi:type IV secretory pathway VirB10-like protein
MVALGQSRALLVWQRIIMPDGSSIAIDNLPATDTAGYAGLKDEVDFHTWQLLKGALRRSTAHSPLRPICDVQPSFPISRRRT